MLLRQKSRAFDQGEIEKYVLKQSVHWLLRETDVLRSYPLTGTLFLLAASQTASNLRKLSAIEQFMFFLWIFTEGNTPNENELEALEHWVIKIGFLNNKKKKAAWSITTISGHHAWSIITISGPHAWSIITISGPHAWSITTISGPHAWSITTISGPHDWSITTISGPHAWSITTICRPHDWSITTISGPHA